MQHRRTNYGFTLIELLVVIAILSILAALLFPVFAGVKDKARQTACISNARQIGMGLVEYVDDNDEHFMQQTDNDAGNPDDPTADPNPAHFLTWLDWVQPYMTTQALQKCPSYSGAYPIPDGELVPNRFLMSTYAISAHVVFKEQGALSAIPQPASTLLIAESASGITWFADEQVGATSPDFIMCNGEMHNVIKHSGLTDDWGDPAISASVTGIGADGHAIAMHMDNTNGGGITQDAQGLMHDPPGGWNGLYTTGPDGELSF